MCSLCCVVGGTVDVASLSQIIVNRVRDLKTTPDELKDAFQVFDKQGTGMISVHDLKLSLTTLGERLADEELDELIREVDQDGEGMVSYQGASDYNVITFPPPLVGGDNVLTHVCLSVCLCVVSRIT